MTFRAVCRTVLTFVVAVHAVQAQAQSCDGRAEQRLDQESYVALTDRVYVYAPDIESLGTSGGWRRFELRVLVGTYRAPLLLPKGFLKQNDLQTLLTTRPDIKVSMLSVAGHDPKAGKGPSVNAVLTVNDGERQRTITIRATRVVPVSNGTDHIFLVCTPSG
jgi:hypothetical protein